MSDVEMLCEQNHQRVRWAYEYADYGIREPERTEAEERRYAAKVRRRRHCIRAAATLCTVIHSLGLMVIGMIIPSLTWIFTLNTNVGKIVASCKSKLAN